VDVVNNLRGDDYGFFSAHAANTMSLAVYFCLLVRNRVFQFFMILWSLINCWTRLYLGLHYPGDVLVGLLWGIIAGFIAYLVWHKVYFKISPKLNYISSQYTSTGYSLTDIDVVIAVMVFTFAYAIIRSIII
jgi:undecaprenyl-diphosphatase